MLFGQIWGSGSGQEFFSIPHVDVTHCHCILLPYDPALDLAVIYLAVIEWQEHNVGNCKK